MTCPHKKWQEAIQAAFDPIGIDIKTERNKPKLNQGGYLFVFEKFNKDGDVKFWRCEYFNTKNVHCHARLHTTLNDNIIKELGIHTCIESGAENVGKKQVVTALKRRAAETMEAPAILRANVLQNVPTPVLAQIQNKDAMKKIVKRTRHELEAPPALPANLEALQIPERYQFYQRTDEQAERFLLADSGMFEENGRRHRILIFGRASNGNCAGQMHDIFVDGTFSVAPGLFYQLYVVLARRNDWVFTVLFGLLSSKTQATYERFWDLVKQQWPNFSPQTVSIDYELAAINALRSKFPAIDIRGCLFHLVQNLKKKIGEANLTVRYRNDAAFALQCRLITSIAFLPICEITRAIQALDLHFSPEMAPLMDWFVNNYTGRPRIDGTRTVPLFPPEMWSVHQRVLNGNDRTNNYAEASHRRLQALFSCRHPTIWSFIDILRKEQKARDADMAKCIAGHDPPPKAKKDKDADRRIFSITQKYQPANPIPDHNYIAPQNNQPVIDFLTGISNNYKMDP